MFKTLRLRFTITYVLLVTLSSLAFTFLLTSVSSRRLIDTEIDHMEMVVEEFAEDITLEIDAHREALKLLTAIDNFNPRNTVIAKDYYEAVIDMEIILFENIVYTNNLGVSTSYYKEPLRDVNTAFIKSIRDDSDNKILSNPTLSLISNNPIVLIGIPYHYMDYNIGTLVGSINLIALSQYINDYSYKDQSYSWIMDSEGYFVAHPRFQLNDNLRALYENEVFLEFEDLYSDLLEDTSGYGTYIVGKSGQENFVVFTTIPNTNGWKTGITIPYRALFQNEESTTALLITMGLLVLIITVICTLLLTNRITRPIIDLTNAIASRKVVPLHKTLKHGSNREITRLMDAYNRMTTELYEHMHNLETMVKARTKDLETANQKLYTMATVDKLTGIVNRSQLDDIITQYKIDVDNYALTGFSILFIDINNFKYYNDQFSHDIGDQILKRFSEFFANHSRETDTVGRYGGDEFVIILPKVSMTIAHRIRDNLLNAFEKTEYFIPDLEKWLDQEVSIPANKHLGIAIGIGHYIRNSKTSIDELYLEADQDMYKMKTEMKNKLVK